MGNITTAGWLTKSMEKIDFSLKHFDDGTSYFYPLSPIDSWKYPLVFYPTWAVSFWNDPFTFYPFWAISVFFNRKSKII